MGGTPSKEQTMDQVFNLKFQAKTLEREAKKKQKEVEKEKEKLKKAIQAGDAERARIYAETTIRHQKEGNNYLRLASRVDAVAARIETAMKTQEVTAQMGQVVVTMNAALGSMDLQKTMMIMDKFEKQWETLDVQSRVVEDAMASSTSSTTPQDEVDGLIQQFAEENALNISFMMPDAPLGQKQQQQQGDKAQAAKGQMLH